MDLKRILAKGVKTIFNPAALTNCQVNKNARICSGTQMNNSSINRYSYCGHDCFILNCDIGSFVSIADNCRLGGAMHPIQRVSSSPVFHAGKNVMKKNFCYLKEIETPKTIIGNDVWIGANACIKSGVTIGDGAVIGMGAVVTKDVGPYEIWGGVPAKLIRKRFDEKTIAKLLEVQWWNWDEEKLKIFADSFDNVEDFIGLI